MKQLFQDLKSGNVFLEEVPCPRSSSNHLLVESRCSLVSSGTERALMEFGKAGYFGKARQQPDKVRQSIDKILTDGLMPTVEAITKKLDEPMPLGYSNVGLVLDEGTKGFSVGDRIVSNGFHAEVVRVPINLCARIPNNVGVESAVFSVVGAIALQSVRLLSPTIGEKIAVFGAGLVGQICIQILRASGCRIIAIDKDTERCKLAEGFSDEVVHSINGENTVDVAKLFSDGQGVDGVIIATVTESDSVIHDAAQMCRQRGRIILVGVAGMYLSRADFYQKELTFQVSSSYGPGRYDPNYENKGVQYPIGLVRWTAQRNIEAVLEMMSQGKIDVSPLISQRISIENSLQAYSLLEDPKNLGILIQYGPQIKHELLQDTIIFSPDVQNDTREIGERNAVVGMLGAGNHVSRAIIPALKSEGVKLAMLVSEQGISGFHQGRKAEFIGTSTDQNSIWNSDSINTVFIATPHNQHAKEVLTGIEAGKDIFVEKPMALTLKEIAQIEEAYVKSVDKGIRLRFMVGFNRRFAPLTLKLKNLIDNRKGPKCLIYTVNAGPLPTGHWMADMAISGGRIIGEMCHFLDLMRFIVGYPIKSYHVVALADGEKLETDGSVSLTVQFEDGSMGTVHYFTNGARRFQKERLEVFCGSATLRLNNFVSLVGYGWPGFKKKRLFRQDKGHKACINSFINSVRFRTESPIPIDEMFEVSRAIINISNSV